MINWKVVQKMCLLLIKKAFLKSFLDNFIVFSLIIIIKLIYTKFYVSLLLLSNKNYISMLLSTKLNNNP